MMIKYFASFEGMYKGGWRIYKGIVKEGIHNSQYEYKGMSIDKHMCFETLEQCEKSIPNYDNYVFIDLTI